VMNYVWQHSQQSGGALLVLLAIADHASDDGGNAWPSLPTLALKARLSERQVVNVLHQLEGAGEIVVDRGRGRGQVNHYRVVLRETGNSFSENNSLKGKHEIRAEKVKSATPKKVKSATEKVKPISPEPSIEPSMGGNRPKEPPSHAREERFARFWMAYPRKDKKREAREWFARHRPDDATIDLMIDAIARQAQSAQWQKEGGRFIPMPSSWLNDRRWEDEGVVLPPGSRPRTRLEEQNDAAFREVFGDGSGDVPTALEASFRRDEQADEPRPHRLLVGPVRRAR
jgi:hypothetical protein